ncbi:MAG TPA: hypothetical protein VE954_05900 [Oligoflexus sp.]|uniref:hypothetical protein n=1 Tax=Oligoflexus sp. TaxID=1971216 RepID=UPI002D3BF29F|nr:hypothetical protein [Oligoflexus sp.]HYX32626.1 hypothetical protein [Oligoflexus sp.]
MKAERTLPKFAIATVAILGLQNIGLSQATEDCGYENGVRRYCGNGYAWEFDKISYAVEGNHLFGEKAPDAEWEYASAGWNAAARSCEQNQSGVFVAAPNITIKEAESARYRRLYFSIPVDVMLEADKFLPTPGSALLKYELQANGKTLISSQTLVLEDKHYDASRKYAFLSTKITGYTEINNEELRNVKLVISDLIQKVDPSKDYHCFQFNLLLGKGRIDLLQ